MLLQKNLLSIPIFFLLLFIPEFAQTQNSEERDISAKALLEKANAHAATNLDSLLYYATEAQVILEKEKDWPALIDCQSYFSYYYFNKGDYEQFGLTAKKSVDLCEQYLEKTDPIYLVALNNLAIYLSRKGDYSASVDILKEVLDISIQSGTDERSIAIVKQNISINLRSENELYEAENYLKEALSIYENSDYEDKGKLISITYQQLGTLKREQKKYKEAIVFYKVFIEREGSGKIDANGVLLVELVYTYQSLAKSYIELNQLEQAKKYIDLAINLNGKVRPSDKVISYEVLGRWNNQNNDFEAALNANLESLKFANESLSSFKNHHILARILRNVAQAHFDIKDYIKALDFVQQALVKLSPGFTSIDYNNNPEINQLLSKPLGVEILYLKAQILNDIYQKDNNEKDLLLALENIKIASGVINSTKQSFISKGAKKQLAESANTIYEVGIKIALNLYELKNEKTFLNDAFVFAEENKAGILYQSLQDNLALLVGDIEKSDLEKEVELKREIAFYQRTINEENRRPTVDEDKIKNWEKKLFSFSQSYQTLIEDFEEKYPKYYDLKYNDRQIDLVNVLQDLKKEEAIIEYFVGSKTIYSFILSTKGLNVLEKEKPQDFEDQLEKLRSIINTNPFGKNYNQEALSFNQTSSEFYKLLVNDELNLLPENVKFLNIIPDNVLAYLPFEILVKTEEGETRSTYDLHEVDYLLEDYTISYNFSTSLMEAEFTHADFNLELLAIAPTFGNNIASTQRICTDNELNSLTCNIDEAESIEEIWPGQTFLAKQGSRQNFEQNASKARIIHLATHACIDEENPDLNKIHFTDDFLTTTDLYNLNLNAELAVLSACNTGSGKMAKGEGLMSLSRSFILAGCQSTVTSLWSVDDCSTSNIMKAFYQYLKDGESKDESLRLAKINHLKQADKVTSHPYYWAAFIQSGNPNALPQKAKIPWTFILTGLLGLSIMTFLYNKIKS